MKLKTLAAAIASVGALAAANHAAALVPTDANTATNKVFLAGSSALDPQLTTLIRTQVCNADLITMSNGATAPGSAQTAYLCTVNGSQIPGLAGQTLVIYKRASGGSAYGVAPVLNPSASASVARLDPAGCPATPVDATDPVKHYNCGSATVNDTPIGGISDVEPNLFVGPNLLVSLPEQAQATGAPGTADVIDDGGFTTSTLSAVSFGVEVTTNLRNALQDAQVSIGKLPTGCVGQETEECMPSLSRAEVASIFSGAVASWDKFMVGNQPLTAFGTAGTNTKINACRRSPGSGTQAQFNALFANAPCTGGAVAPLRDNTSFTWRIANAGSGPAQHNNIGTVTGMNGTGALPAIHEGQGSGDVERCLELLNNSTVTRWGIGLNALDRGQGNNGLSLPSDPNNTNAGAKDYLRFIKIDGVAPTLENVANNKYFDWSGSSIQWRTSQYAGGVNNVPNANQLLVLQKIRTDAVTPSDLASSNALIELPAGADYKVGNLAFPSATNVASFPFSLSNPVITSQRVAGGKPNTCVTANIINQGGL